MLIPALVVVPVLAATRLGTRDTAVVAGVSVALAALLGVADGILGDGQYFVRLAVVAGGAALSVPLAAARERAEALRRRSAFLAEAAQVLNSSLEPDATLRNLARLAVPAVCDWCIVDLLEPGGQLRRVAATHEPDDDRIAQGLDDRLSPDLSADTPLTRALRTRGGPARRGGRLRGRGRSRAPGRAAPARRPLGDRRADAGA